jgi:SAM-dependent methyltransferase
MEQTERVMDTFGMQPFQELFYLGMDRKLPNLWKPPSQIFGNVLNLGAGAKIIPGAIPLDYPQWDADHDTIPMHTESCVMIHAYHFLEHVREPIEVLQECQRVLVKGGVMNIVVPYYNAQIAAHDLDHKHVFCEETWRVLFGNPYYDKNKINWSFRVHFNMICGIVERNLCLMTQLVKE